MSDAMILPEPVFEVQRADKRTSSDVGWLRSFIQRRGSSRSALRELGQIEFAANDRVGKWLPVASGHDDVAAPVRLVQTATFLVSRLNGERIAHTFAPALP